VIDDGGSSSTADNRTDARPAAGKAPVHRRDARTLPLPRPVNGTEAARDRGIGSQPPQLGHEGTTTLAAKHGTDVSLGVCMGGNRRLPFRAPTGGTVPEGDKIPLGPIPTAEASARGHDGWAAATHGRALDILASDELGSARVPRKRAALTTRPGAHVRGLPQQQRNDNDDEPEQLTDSDGSDGYDDDGGATSSERAGRGAAQQVAPAADIARGSKADCVRYAGVRCGESKASRPFFRATIPFNSNQYHICCCPTAEPAARAYDAVACMILGRALNFLTTTPAAASSARQRKRASAVPAESDILAAIAAVRQAQPQLSRTGAVKYFGVSMDKRRGCNPYQARIQVDGIQVCLGFHPTAEAAARAYDAAARTIPSRKLNFPTGGSSAAAVCGDSRTDARSPPARGRRPAIPAATRRAR
jgi:hypothetical protein